MNARPHSAFTLLEVVIVLALAAVVVAAASLSLGKRHEDWQLRSHADQLQALLESASDYSLIHHVPLRLRSEDSGYEMEIWRPIEEWQPLPAPWPVPARPAGVVVQNAEPVLIDSEGEIAPFHWQLALPEAALGYELHYDTSGRFHLRTHEAQP